MRSFSRSLNWSGKLYSFIDVTYVLSVNFFVSHYSEEANDDILSEDGEEGDYELTMEEAKSKVSDIDQALPNEKFGDMDEKEAIAKVNNSKISRE